MDVGLTELREHLSDWVTKARDGEEVVVTDRGLPVARLVGVDSTPLLERLIADGVIARPKVAQRPRVAGTERPRPRRPVADYVSDQRR